jgi:predicted PurR-regulated permease PerM
MSTPDQESERQLQDGESGPDEIAGPSTGGAVGVIEETPAPPAEDPFAGYDPAVGEPPPQRVPPVVVPRAVQVVAVVLLVLGGYALARAAHTVVLIFMVAGVIALILNPFVAFLQNRHLPRGLAVLAVYLTFFLSLGGAGFLLATPISHQVKSFTRDLPSITKSANKSLGNVQSFFNRQGIHVQIVKPGKTALQTLQERVTQGSSSVVSFTGNLLKTVVSLGFDVILVFVLSVYMLVYGQRIGALVRRLMPKGDGTPADDYPIRVQRAVSVYIRAQLLFSLVMGTTAGLSLYLFGLVGLFSAGKSYAAAFGVFFGLMELIPFVGPVLGAIPPVLVALFQDPLSAVWVVVLFIGIQQLEGHIVAPQIFGHALRVNPLLVIFALTVGGEVFGVVGALIALPLAAIIRETAVYLQRHVVLEPWNPRRPPPPPAGPAEGAG